jgi:N-dimethylarginine dimethylaminohydrolase
MCPPTFFGVEYEINPWMALTVKVDRDLAQRQWDGLVATLRAAGAEIELIEPVQGLPDMVFTANGGLVNGGRFVPSRFRHWQRSGEEEHFVSWFQRHGYELHALPDDLRFEGAGDALPFGATLLAGCGPRTDVATHRELGAEVLSLELVDPRFYHLDITFCPLDERHAIVNPQGWTRAGAKQVCELVQEPLVLTEAEAVTFCQNAVVVDRTFIAGACPARVRRQLEAWGFEVVVAPVGEFLKAGGGVRCLTLALDVELA